jgi:hypothetical protein
VGTAPAYPDNTLRLTADKPFVAGTVVKVGMAGHADWKGSTDDTTTPYVQYVTDDVAWYELPITVQQPACRASRATLRRGTRLTLMCNASGPATVKFSGRSKRTVQVKIPAKDGRVRVPLGSLRAGRYRVAVTAGELALGRPFTVRIR